MEAQLTSAELIGDRRGKVAAGVGFILFIVLLLIPIFFKLNPPPGQPGIAVLLAFDDQGQGDNPADPGQAVSQPTAEPTPTPPPPPTPEPEPEPAPAPPPTKVTKPVKQQRDVIQSETAAEIAVRKQKARKEAERREADRVRKQREDDIQRRKDAAEKAVRDKQAKARAEQAAREAAIAEAERKAEAERRARAKAEADRKAKAEAFKAGLGGAFNNGGSGSGNSGKPGTEGRDDGIRTGSGSTPGAGGRVSGGLGGRGLVSSPAVRENCQRSGTVVLSVCVDQSGKISSADFTQSGSKNANSCIINAAKANAKNWKFKSEPTAPATQCGKITYTFKVR